MAVDTTPVDPGSLIRSRQYQGLLVLAAIIGVLVSLASWGFLVLVHEIQVGVYEHLPVELGYDTVPWWWPLPWLGLAGAGWQIASPAGSSSASARNQSSGA